MSTEAGQLDAGQNLKYAALAGAAAGRLRLEKNMKHAEML